MAEVSTKIWEISRAGLETEICPEIFRSHSSQSLRKTRDFDDCDCILRGPGNCLVPVTVPAAKGVPVQRCVTARKMKVDQATGRLDKHDPYKSRHSADGGFAKGSAPAYPPARSPPPRPLSTT